MASGGPSADNDAEVDRLRQIWSKFGIDSTSIAQPNGNVNLTAQLLRDHGIGNLNKDHPVPESSVSRSRRRAEIDAFRKSLPIYSYKEQLIRLVSQNQVTVVVGATGSGKSTQITQYLLESGIAKRRIACTQPRRVAATSLARRVALEYGTTVGDKVGYKIRFENCAGTDTVIKYMTDGCLVTEFVMDRTVEDYSVIILDEAHERSVHTDVVLGLLKLCLKVRPDLKVIVTSATLDSDKFSGYFNGAPILNIPGRGFPVEIEYAQYMDSDFLNSAALKVMMIHEDMPLGDILVFLPGQEEIEQTWDNLIEKVIALSRRRLNLPEMIILPFYSSLPPEALNEISEPTPAGKRKVILATNIAETSLTIDNIMYIVDPGYAKEREYNPKTGIESLIVKPITKAQAIQRAGRTGRQAPGKVYRLYTRYTYDTMAETPTPEIQRANIEDVVLQLASLGITDIVNFPFIDPPQTESVLSAMEYLLELQALITVGQSIEMTLIGRKMSQFPLDPTLAKVLIKSAELGCAEEVLTIVSILSTQNTNVFVRGKKKNQAEVTLKTAQFRHVCGDHLTFLNVYKAWQDNYCKESWCQKNFVHFKVLEEAVEIRRQLESLMHHQNLRLSSCGSDVSRIQHALCSGFFHKIARKSPKGFSYQAYGGGSLEEVYIFPGSALFNSPPPWLLFHEVVKTKKPYMRSVIRIDPIWIKEHSPTFFVKLTKVYPDLKFLC